MDGFVPLNVAVLTVSDTRTPETDNSGALLAEEMGRAGHHVIACEIVTDDEPTIRERLRAWTTSAEVQVVIVTGGTGGLRSGSNFTSTRAADHDDARVVAAPGFEIAGSGRHDRNAQRPGLADDRG